MKNVNLKDLFKIAEATKVSFCFVLKALKLSFDSCIGTFDDGKVIYNQYYKEIYSNSKNNAIAFFAHGLIQQKLLKK